MKLKATIEVEYDVDSEDYSFSDSEDKKELILKFERNVFLTTIYDTCIDGEMCTGEPIIVVTVVENVQ